MRIFDILLSIPSSGICWVALLSLGGGLAGPPAHALEEDLPCEKKGQAMLLEYGDMVVCTLDSLVDKDSFSWDGEAGDQALIRTVSLSGGIEPCFEVRDPADKPIDKSDCAFNNQTTQLIDDLRLVSSGRHTITVEDRGSDETGSYRLVLERIAPPSPTAQFVVGFGLLEQDLVDELGDVDFYLFPSEGGGDTVQIEARGVTGGIEPCLYLYPAEGGAPVATSSCRFNGDFTQEIEYGLVSAGTHILRVEDKGSDERGEYQLTVRCVSGPCRPLPRARAYLDLAALASVSGSPRPEIAGLRLERKGQKDGTIRDQTQVVILDGRTRRVVRVMRFFGDGWTPKALVALADLPASANGAPELAVLAVSAKGKSQVRIKDAKTKATVAILVAFNALWEARNMAAVPDRNKDGIQEIAVLAVNKKTGVALTRIIDPVTGKRLWETRL